MSFNRREFVQTAGLAALATATMPTVLAQDAKKIVLAFVGVAHIHTPGYVDLVKKRGDVVVKAVWDHDRTRAEKTAKELGSAAVDDVKAIWADPEIVAIVICSETNRHRDLVLAAAKAGKHLFVEKPLGITGQESWEMAKAIEQANLLFTTGYFQRTDPKLLFLKSEIAKGNFGTITRVRGSNCHNGSLEGWFDTDWRWMTDRKLSGVGAFGDLGTHKLDILMWLLGDVAAVTAQIKSVTGRYGDCDETGEALIRFQNGVIGTLAAGWVDIEDPVQLLISGTEGNAAIVNSKLYYRSDKVPTSDNRKPQTNLPPEPRPPLQQFLDAVAGAKDQPLVKPSEAAARVTVMEAMYEGARGEKWVKLA
ncbi:MAG: Gfo/Idh/MocA family protein [Verrucomicrobiota bacterium]